MKKNKADEENAALSRIEECVGQMRLQEAASGLAELEGREASLTESGRLELRLLRAICSGRSGENGIALKAAREAAEMAGALGHERSLMTALRYQGNCLIAMDEHAEAIEAFRAALKRARAADDKREIAAAYNNLGAVYRSIDDYEEAVACFNLDLRIHEENQNQEEIHIARLNLAVAQFMNGQIDEAESSFWELLKSGEGYADSDHTTIPLWGLAGVAAQRGDLAAAREQFETVISQLLESGQAMILIEARLDWAEVLADNGYPEEAHEILALVRSEERLAERPELLARSTELLAKVLEEQHRFDEALEQMKALREIERQRAKKRADSRTDALRIIHETERAQHLAEMEQLKNEDLAKALSEAERQRQLAEEANRLKSEILRMVAHDLRNPIGNVLSLLELAITEKNTELADELFELARDKTQASLQLLERLMDAAAVEEGRVTIQAEPIPFDAFLAELIESDSQPEAAEKKQQIIRRGSDRGRTLYADPARCRQILGNLFSNAIKYSPIGGIILYDYRLEGDCLVFEIMDQGPGIPPDQLERIFLPFNRLASSVPTGGESSMGLGLSIAKRLAMAHGGDLEAFSDGLGHGSRFRLSLPHCR